MVSLQNYNKRNILKANAISPSINLSAKASRSWFTASEIASIYAVPTPTEAKVVVGVISFGGGLYGTVAANGVLTNSDCQTYWSAIGISPANMPTVIVVPISGATNIPDINDGGATLENTLDVETIGGVCPSANLTIILYIAPNSISEFVGVFQYALNTTITANGQSYKPTILSVSWGAPEIYFSNSVLTNFNTLLQAATNQGVNVCVATGDNGSNNGVGGSGNYTDFPSSSPYVTAVGGTRLVSPTLVYNAQTIETAWTYGGGAISAAFPKPAYQSAITASGRSVPDVAAVADPNTGVIFIINGITEVIGGTSVAAPVIAGFIAATNPNKFINNSIYSAGNACFHDILVGTNGGYITKSGYDNCTGLGSIVGNTLSQYLLPVTPVPATSLTLNEITASLNVNQTSQLVATVNPVNTTNKAVNWSSNNTAIATVTSGGLITGLVQGSAIITCSTADGSNLSATVAVTVNPIVNPVSVTGVTMSQTTVSVGQIATVQLSATVNPTTATNKAVTWSTNNAKVSVSQSGLVTGLLVGSSIVTVTTADGSKIATCTVTVIIPVTSVSLNTTSLSLAVGANGILRSTIQPTNAGNKTVTWSSANTSVATVNSSGVVNAVGNGTTTITVTTNDGSKTAQATVTVTTTITRIKLNANTINLSIGQTSQAVPTITPSTASTQNLSWRSAFTHVATVNSTGLITATGNGSTQIIVSTSNNKIAYMIVTVTTRVTGLSLSLSSLIVARGTTSTLVATIQPITASNKILSWFTNNGLVATVNSSGVVKGIKTGNAIITARTNDGSYTSICTVTVVTAAHR